MYHSYIHIKLAKIMNIGTYKSHVIGHKQNNKEETLGWHIHSDVDSIKTTCHKQYRN